MSDPTRTLAFRLIQEVTENRRTLDDALDSLPAAEPRDRAAAHRLAASVLRHAGVLDAVLEPFVRRAPPPAVRTLLRMGAAQLLFLGTPDHAAVSTIVGLARAQGLDSFAGLANAVLRRVAEGGARLFDGLDPPRLDTPAWLWGSWGADARAIATAHAEEAPLDLSLLPGVPPPAGGTVLPTGSVRFPPGTAVTDVPGWAEGQVWVQDAAAALPARLLAPMPGERIADLCAAPGGKTAQLAAAAARVIAVERDPGRARLLAGTLARLHLSAEIVVADALVWQPSGGLDAVLLDAPCSATGTIRRHPDVPHLRRSSDVATLAAQQHRLLHHAARMLRPGGRLIYSVCSLQREEGPEVAAGCGLVAAPFTAAELAGVPWARTPEGWLRTHPGQPLAMDGFFVARFRRGTGS